MKHFVFIGILLLSLLLISLNFLNIEKTEMILKEESTFAGGCFWCMEAAFQETNGVIDVISGYSGGEKENPTYEEVLTGETGHMESVRVIYDSSKISYEELLNIFWRQIDPTDSGGQFTDRGSEYEAAIFYHDKIQKEIAEKSKKELEISEKFDKPIVTKILPLSNFYRAEEYHQDFYKKRSARYENYAKASGRKGFIEETWSEFEKPSDEELKKILTPIQYKITQEDKTEKPFDNKYWDNKEPGIYVDLLSGDPLFSSKDKFESGTGWPSFTKPLEEENIFKKIDLKLIFPRTEIRSKKSDSHIGHLFKDGPKPSGLRYCMNSAALKFIPKENLEEEGYGKYLESFN